MKNINFYLVVCCLVFLFSSCEEDKLLRYGGEADAPANVYFTAKRWTSGYEKDVFFPYESGNHTISVVPSRGVDTLSYSFSETFDSEIIVLVPISYMGNLSSKERKISYQIDSESSAQEGVDYEILASYVPTDSVFGGILIKFNKQNLTNEKELTITFKLLENEFFGTAFDECSRSRTESEIVNPTIISATFTEGWSKPPLWDSRNKMAFGEWSVKKAEILINVLGFPRDYVLDYVKMPSMLMPLHQLFRKYLDDMKAKGTPVLEEDGTEMTIN